MSALLDARARAVATEMNLLGMRIARGDDAQLLHWVMPGRLAVAHRPLRYHPWYGGSGAPIPKEATGLVLEWIERIKNEGVKSAISFMHDRDLRSYADLDLGMSLTDRLIAEGLHVAALPWEDPHHKRSTPAEKQKNVELFRAKALQAFDELPAPLVLLCSAGVDRSAPVAAYIEAMRGEGADG